MSDRILSIGQNALETADARVKAMMNNIVNAQTPGFKKTDIVSKSFPMMLDEAMNSLGSRYPSASMAPKVTGAYKDQSHGPLFKTGSPTDAAIGGNGYFVVQGNEGEIYTRDGRFTLDQDGKLITVSGSHPVLGKSGPIMVIPGSTINIAQNGGIIVDDVEIDRLRVALFDDPKKLESLNDSFYRMPEGETQPYLDDDNPRVIQGYIESSNVNIMEEMMEMIYLSRVNGMNTKMIQTRDGSLARAMEMGKPAQ